MLAIHFERPDPLYIRFQDLDDATRMLYLRWEDTEEDEDWEKFQESLLQHYKVENHLVASTEVREIYEIEL